MRPAKPIVTEPAQRIVAAERGHQIERHLLAVAWSEVEANTRPTNTRRSDRKLTNWRRSMSRRLNVYAPRSRSA